MGYVGLVTSACLAEWGNEVVGIEAGTERLGKLRHGEIPFYEPGLAGLVRTNAAQGRLRFTDQVADVVQADAVFIAVGTHDGSGGWQSDTLAACVDQVLPLMSPGSTLVVRSTVPPGFIEELRAMVRPAGGPGGRRDVAALLNP